MTHKIHIHVYLFPFSWKGDEEFFFSFGFLYFFFSESGFLIMFYRKGETNGGLIGETSKKPME